jgi:putative two-component system response regulator
MAEAEKKPVILAVDDSADLLMLMAKALGPDYQVLTAEDAGTAIELASGTPRPDLILLDVEMPGASGFDLIQVLKSEGDTAGIPIVFLTGKTDAKDEAHGFSLGAVDYVTKPINAAVLRARVRTHVALANQRAELEIMVRERTADLEKARAELIRRLSRAMEFHESAAVGNRVMRLAHYAKLIAQAAGAKPAVCEMLMTAAPLHDIGKLAVPSEILRKNEKLSAPDWDQVKRHAQLGAEIIGEGDDPLLKVARTLALTHHEHWDGSGYPQGLKGDAIPWPGRVMAIVDSFEAMTTTQFYRDPLPFDEAAAQIVKAAGTKFEPSLVEAFKKALPQLRQVKEKYSDALGTMLNLDFRAPGSKPQPAAAAGARPGATQAVPKPGAGPPRKG